jgi:pentose-5-phosphate-3-epimerase
MSAGTEASRWLSPSLADGRLRAVQVQAIDKAGCDWIHVDVMV